MTPNADLVRRGYEAHVQRDYPTVTSMLHPEVEFYQTELLPWGGNYRGHQGVQDFFRRLNEKIDSRLEIEGMHEAGDQVAVTGRIRGRVHSTGQPFDLPIVHLLTVRDGKAARFEAYIDTPGMLRVLEAAPEN